MSEYDFDFRRFTLAFGKRLNGRGTDSNLIGEPTATSRC